MLIYKLLGTLQIVTFDGKADAPLSRLFCFQKAFFLHSESKDLYGRVQLQKGPLGNVLYPLYYTSGIGPAIVPGIIKLQLVTVKLLDRNARPGHAHIVHAQTTMEAWHCTLTQSALATCQSSI